MAAISLHIWLSSSAISAFRLFKTFCQYARISASQVERSMRTPARNWWMIPIRRRNFKSLVCWFGVTMPCLLSVLPPLNARLSFLILKIRSNTFIDSTFTVLAHKFLSGSICSNPKAVCTNSLSASQSIQFLPLRCSIQPKIACGVQQRSRSML